MSKPTEPIYIFLGLSYSISGRVADLIKGKDPEKIRKLFNAPKRSTDLDLISLHSFSTTLTSLSPSLSISSITPENI
ncbi:hypothetical protein LOD99_1354 [Oopsacas minuta]|uniref:SKP1 component dimerisation domain-containing protein n=1 Tax=Oopsacas minuta TaxID=111878 RepID=A0AAV7K6Z1_9METZ|nr:hypothetical protein LOD99_1354 [Oopsacas minuta]